MRGLLLAGLACLVSLIAGRRVELVLAGGSDSCGEVCCCSPAGEPACCADEGGREELPRVAATCGCARPGELHLVLVAGDWVLPPQPAELAEPPRAEDAEVAAPAPRSRRAEPETPPPRGGVDRTT